MSLGNQELKDRVERHGKWLRSESGGERLIVKEFRENFIGADLRSADLRSANLSGANLSGANLRSANLSGANLRSADLSGADLRSANLRSANLSGANLSGADLRSANLSGANLSGADLSGANLSEIKADFLTRLALAESEIPGLYDYLQKGKVDGSSYEGECACFVGTVAKLRNENYGRLTCDLRPDSSSPTERFFMGILKGDTPSNNQISKFVCEWIEEYAKEKGIKLPKYRLVSSDECPAAFVDPTITDLAQKIEVTKDVQTPAEIKERRQFIKAAMVGLLSTGRDPEQVPKAAVKLADSVLKEIGQ
jgi:hypothetical protein